MVHHIDANHVNAVNRSTSCVGDIGSSIITSSLQGLPKRADTFGGFDSQQRGLLGDQCSTTGYSINGRQLQDMVVQLADVCGEIFSLLVHQMSPIVYQNYYQLQRRMEDLREAQQRLETEKALWQQQFNSQKETIDKERNDLNTLKANLQKEQEDITQQREQLYRYYKRIEPCIILSPTYCYIYDCVLQKIGGIPEKSMYLQLENSCTHAGFGFPGIFSQRQNGTECNSEKTCCSVEQHFNFFSSSTSS